MVFRRNGSRYARCFVSRRRIFSTTRSKTHLREMIAQQEVSTAAPPTLLALHN
jgi:hypothetical protein